MAAEIDWSVFDQFGEDTAYCRCGKVYRSHVKMVQTENGLDLHSRKPCPGCGCSKNNVRRATSDPETYSIGDEDIDDAR